MIKFTVFVFVFLTFWATDVQACLCDISFKHVDRQVKKAKEHATAVFTGRIVDIIDTKDPEGKPNGGIEAILEVSEVWKGEISGRVSVFTNKDGGTCGYDFVQGKEYLVYAYVDTYAKDMLMTHLCTRTTIAEGKYYLKERKYLGKPLLKLEKGVKKG